MNRGCVSLYSALPLSPTSAHPHCQPCKAGVAITGDMASLSCFDFQPIREAHFGGPLNLWVTWGHFHTTYSTGPSVGVSFLFSMKSGMRAWGPQPNMAETDQRSLYLGREG